MPSLAELRKQILKEKEGSKEVQEEKVIPGEKKEIKLESLKSPKAPEPIKSPPKKDVVQEQDLFIDWDYLVHNSSFQRGFTEFIKYTFPQYKNVNPRASKEIMDKQLKDKTEEINEALTIYKKLDNEQIRELNSNPLYLKQKTKNNK